MAHTLGVCSHIFGAYNILQPIAANSQYSVMEDILFSSQHNETTTVIL